MLLGPWLNLFNVPSKYAMDKIDTNNSVSNAFKQLMAGKVRAKTQHD